MTTHRSQSSDIGHSRFAKRGLSSEERMPDDDSSETFSEDGERSLRESQTAQADGRMYGSGGSYGYGGAFEHGGQRGYDVSFVQHSPVDAGSDRYEAQGKFGRDTEGYSREGIGHPGKEEKRPAGPVTDGAPASGHPQVDDARQGYTQESGYVQSGGNPTPDARPAKADKKKVSRKSN